MQTAKYTSICVLLWILFQLNLVRNENVLEPTGAQKQAELKAKLIMQEVSTPTLIPFNKKYLKQSGV